MSKTNENPGVSPLSYLSDGEPVEEIGVELKTNYKDMAKRYALAERLVWSKTPHWKQCVILECRTNGTNDRIFDEYAKEIRLLADDESMKFSDKLPAVPETKKPYLVALPA